jgi:hypothetical protein
MRRTGRGAGDGSSLVFRCATYRKRKSMAVDLDAIRRLRLSEELPPEWPEGVYGVSMKGIGLLGIHEKSGKLRDGREVVTRSAVRLGTFERWIACFAAAGTFGTFAVNAGGALGYWN